MSKTKTSAISFYEILKKSKTGTYKLPGFQRKWKWTTKQVMTFYDSLRLGYPIGAFLFLSSNDAERLAPRSFYGSGKKAKSNPKFESLVLDGQQRITAGLSLYYGLEDVEGSEFYLNLDKIAELLRDKKVNIEDDVEVERFCEDLEIDDGYLVPIKTKRVDRSFYFFDKNLLWSAFLAEELQNALDELLEQCENKETVKIVKKVVRRFLKPNVNIQVPVIELGSEFDLAAISKVFSTINSTGKLLTPFELVVAILYPNNIMLEEEVNDFKSKYPFYANMDKNGEVLLQTIALLAGKSPKKSDLPKNIDYNIYNSYSAHAVEYLNGAGEFLTNALGLGLDVTDKLIPYDSIFAPFSICHNYIEQTFSVHNEIAKAKNKLKRWFVASAITQRYQEGIHNKQANDVKEIKAWIDKDEDIPNWIRDTQVTISIRNASPSGAIGKLMICLLNSNDPKDPILDERIGFKDKTHVSQVHHIFPTRWVSKGIMDYRKDKVDTNLALNTMLLSSKTNADWLNFDPAAQINQSLKSLNSRERLTTIFERQFISQEAIEILEKKSKTNQDYDTFIALRYVSLVKKLSDYEIFETDSKNEYPTELESPSIANDSENKL